MPPLTNVNPDDITPAALAAAERLAGRVHITHCCSRRDVPQVPGRAVPVQRIQFPTILDEFDGRLPLSGATCRAGRVSCGAAALYAENAFRNQSSDFPEREVIYCYVGRVDPRYGRVALAYHWAPGEEPARVHWATPFDTGGMVVEGTRPMADLPFPPQDQSLSYPFPLAGVRPDDVPRRVQYTLDSAEAADQWRKRFALWLAAYFPTDPRRYWDADPMFDAAGQLVNRPEQDDPEQLYSQVAARAAARNPPPPGQYLPPTATAWTWEVMLKGEVRVDECEWWCADESTMTEMDEWVEKLTEKMTPAARARLDRWDRMKAPGRDLSPGNVGLAEYARRLEDEIIQHATT